MLKKELRNIYLNKRKKLSPTDRLKLDDLLLIQLQRLIIEGANVLFTYFPAEKNAEPNTFLFVDYLRYLFPDIQICYPKINRKTHEMQALLVSDETEYEINTFGLSEPLSDVIISPDEIDLIFVPLLCFDAEGFRVGFGKGYYDKFLKKCGEDVIKIGFSYFEVVDEIEDINEWDVPLDYCITPDKIYVFK